MADGLTTYSGGCHCGGVRFEADLPAEVEVEDCNCSICAMSGNDHIIVPASRFRFTRGEELLSEYRFGSRTARHLFCRVCGIKSVYIPRSNPDGYAVTWRCLDDWETLQARVTGFDGQNWEANAARLAHKSRD